MHSLDIRKRFQCMRSPDVFVFGFYLHMPIGKVWIYRLLFVISFVCTVTATRKIGMCGYTAIPEDGPFCVFCLFARLRISQPRIKLATSNVAWRFIGVEGRESPILGNFASLEAQNWTNRPAREGRVKDDECSSW